MWICLTRYFLGLTFSSISSSSKLYSFYFYYYVPNPNYLQEEDLKPSVSLDAEFSFFSSTLLFCIYFSNKSIVRVLQCYLIFLYLEYLKEPVSPPLVGVISAASITSLKEGFGEGGCFKIYERDSAAVFKFFLRGSSEIGRVYIIVISFEETGWDWGFGAALAV